MFSGSKKRAEAKKGKRRIYLAQLEKIANILHRPIEYFLQPVEDEAVRAESRAEPAADFTKPKTEQHCYQEIANKNPAHPPVAAGQEDKTQLKNLLAAYKMLSPEGKRLAVNFVVWLQKREVGNNG